MAMPTPSQPVRMSPLVDIERTAELLGVEVRHVRRLVFERRIPYIKWGHLLRFDVEEIQGWIDQHRQEPGGDDEAA